MDEINVEIEKMNKVLSDFAIRKDQVKPSLSSRCDGCLEIINTSLPYVTIAQNGKQYHEPCFKCDSCQALINTDKGDKFVYDNGRPKHVTCANNMSRSSDAAFVCHGCKTDISVGKYIKHDATFYHSACFKCFRCKTSIGPAPFSQLKNEILCEQCVNKAAAPAFSNLSSPAPKAPLSAYKSLENLSAPSNTLTASEPSISLRSSTESLPGARSSFNPSSTANTRASQKDTSNSKGQLTTSNPFLASLGGTDECPACHKKVYPFEQVYGPATTKWHHTCLICKVCKKPLDSMANVKAAETVEVYCRNCLVRWRYQSDCFNGINSGM